MLGATGAELPSDPEPSRALDLHGRAEFRHGGSPDGVHVAQHRMDPRICNLQQQSEANETTECAEHRQLPYRLLRAAATKPHNHARYIWQTLVGLLFGIFQGPLAC